MKPFKEEVFKKASLLMQEHLQTFKLNLIMDGIDVNNIELTDIQIVIVKTNSSTLKRYHVIRHMLKHDDETFELDLEIFNDFGIQPTGYYEVFYDTSNGTHVEVVENEEEEVIIGVAIAEFLSQTTYAQRLIKNNEVIFGFQEEEVKNQADLFNSKYLKDLPGVIEVKANRFGDLTSVNLKYENDLEMPIDTEDFIRAFSNHQYKQNTHTF